MDDLIAFLRARLDERETKARATGENRQVWITTDGGVDAPYPERDEHGEPRPYKPGDILDPVCERAGWGDVTSADAAHIAANDPASVMADVESKRLIIADCERAITRAKASKHGDDYERWPPWSKLAYRTVWNLAQPFAGHPDYRESPFAAPVIAFMTWLESESGGRDTP